MKRTGLIYLAAAVLLVSSCTAPRNIIASGKVTTTGTFMAGFNASFNAATSPLSKIDDVSRAAIDAIDSNRDSIFYNQSVATLTSGLLAYALDPVTVTSDFYLRYGVMERVDVGYRYASGAHVFDAMYQFMGSTGTAGQPGETGGMYGSIGLQYSGQSANLPSKLGLNRLSSIFRFDFARKDLLIPLVFSYSFGPEETYGNISFGVVYGHTNIRYGFNPSKVLVRNAGNAIERLPAFNQNQQFSSFGAFVNAKLGYRYAWIVPALSVYHQNYGSYNVFGEQQQYKGLTFIPSLGVQIRFGKGK